MADEEAPMMDEMMMEDKPEDMMEEKMMEEEEEEKDELQQKLDDGAYACCCCLCECSNVKTKDLSCCCIFPIKCGVLLIGIIILAIIIRFVNTIRLLGRNLSLKHASHEK